MERDERASFTQLGTHGLGARERGDDIPSGKGFSFEAKYPARFEMWQNAWIERQTTPSSLWQYELIKMMNLVEEKEIIEHLPNDTSPMLRETTELKDIAKIRELTRAKMMLEFQSSLLD